MCRQEHNYSRRTGFGFGGNEIIPCQPYFCGYIGKRFFNRRSRPDFAFVSLKAFAPTLHSIQREVNGAVSVRRSSGWNWGCLIPIPSVEATERCRQKEPDLRDSRRPGHTVTLVLAVEEDALPDIPLSRFPLFVKPAGGGNSIGIDKGSVVRNPRQLARRNSTLTRCWPVGFVADNFCPVLAQWQCWEMPIRWFCRPYS